MTPASDSKKKQLLFPNPEWPQSTSRCSLPEQFRSSKIFRPNPAPNVPPLLAMAPTH